MLTGLLLPHPDTGIAGAVHCRRAPRALRAVRRWRGGMLSEEFRPGWPLAGYRLEERIGAGGMAVVFRARDERLGRLVALKILASEVAEDQEFRRRFIAESRAAAKVEHPHIIPVYEAGEAEACCSSRCGWWLAVICGGCWSGRGAGAGPGCGVHFPGGFGAGCRAPGRACASRCQAGEHPGRCEPGSARSCVPVGLRRDQGGRVVGKPDRPLPGHPELLGAGADPGPGGGQERSVRAGVRLLT